MAVFKNSRYENANLYRVLTAEGFRHPALYTNDPYPDAFSYRRYQVKAGDRIDLLAEKFYGNSSYWWVIANANPEVFYPEDLTPGDVIRIPVA